jgi:putative ABC transport system permease protein
MFSVVLKRLRYRLGLSLSTFLGILVVLSLVICVPVFTNAVLSEVLQHQLQEKAEKFNRSLFGLHVYYYDNSAYSPLTLEGSQKVSRFIERTLVEKMGLRVEQVVRRLATRSLAWEPVHYLSSKPPFERISLRIAADNLAPENTSLVEGSWPQVNEINSTIQVAVHEDLADEKFINVGDILQSGDLQIEVTGIFRANDEASKAWFNNPQVTYKDEVWTPFETFPEQLTELVNTPVDLASWYAIVDDQSLRFNRSKDYARDMVRLESDIKIMLPNAHIDYSPSDMLQLYETRMRSLKVLLLSAGAPIILLAIFFTILTSSIAVQQAEGETLTMRGRGVSFPQVVLINGLESILLILIALPFSVLVGWIAATLMGKTELFMTFNWSRGVDRSLLDIDLVWLLIVCLAIVLARMLPLFSMVRASVVSHKQERGRNERKPAWQRFYLDFLLLLVALYAYFQQSRSGLVSQPDPGGGSAGFMQYDPLLLFASSLFVVAACMIFLRLWSVILKFSSRLTERVSKTWLYMAIQEIARRPGDYRDFLLLIMISLSLSIYAASMAKTFHNWLYDSIYYRGGADLVVREYELPAVSSSLPSSPTTIDKPDLKPGETVPYKTLQSLLSLEKHLEIPEIENASFVGQYDAQFTLGSGKRAGVLLGIDRMSFPKTAYFREDFAKPKLDGISQSSTSLGSLMNALASEPDGLLAQDSFLEETGLRIGDKLKVNATLGLSGQIFDREMKIVGAYHLFPTVYPKPAPTLIANLDTLFGYPEAVTDYDVWLKLEKDVQVQSAIDKLRKASQQELNWVDVRSNAREEVYQMIEQPEWVGLFGILNVGFILTGLMSGIGFLLYATASMRRRFIQIGILQAIGLHNRQMIISLILEQVLLMVMAIFGGALVGLVTARLYIPGLQIGQASGTLVPPFVLSIGWEETAWLCLVFVLMLVVTIAITVYNLVHIRIFQAVKMGEAL